MTVTSYPHIPAERCACQDLVPPKPDNMYEGKWVLLHPIGGLESGAFMVSEILYSTREDAVKQAKVHIIEDENDEAVVILRVVEVVRALKKE